MIIDEVDDFLSPIAIVLCLKSQAYKYIFILQLFNPCTICNGDITAACFHKCKYECFECESAVRDKLSMITVHRHVFVIAWQCANANVFDNN